MNITHDYYGYDQDWGEEDEGLDLDTDGENDYTPRIDLVAEADYLITSLLLEWSDGTTARDSRITRVLARAKARLTRRTLAELPF